jgi:glycosyltransferase involved in cell wall biosynthesis
MSRRRVLLHLGQMAGDPASGAARSMLGTVEILAADREAWEVFSLGTSASEKLGGLEMEEHFRQLGIAPEVGEFSGRRVWRYEYRGVKHCVLDVGKVRPEEWEKIHGGAYDRLYQEMLRKPGWAPGGPIDMVVTYGGRHGAVARRRMAKERGCAVVFGLRNMAYMVEGAFRDVDAVFTASEFVTGRYRQTIGLQSTVVPVPIDWEDVVAEKRERVFITAINPSVEKGLFFLARLVEELGKRRPDIPVLVIESRGVGGQLIATGKAAGFDLVRHESVMVSPGVARPRDIFAVTRVLLVPSVWDEPFGRVAVEAMLNGIPAIVSDRGGLPEAVGDGGIMLPVPRWMTERTSEVPGAEAVEAWMKWIERLVDDERVYADWCARAEKAAEKFRPERVAERVRAFFAAVQPPAR